MKTLKKTLCLVLAVVMVFGLCAFSASADLTYPDNDKITYLEAVDVMSGIGILQGDERGFRPTDDITRAEAAKILAYIMIGDSTQADALKAGSDPFTDVPATHWAAGYIAYCATTGVIKGMGDGTYHPGDNVTGLQFATMLLRALGYGKNEEYEGADWAISASKDALRLGVFEHNPAGASATVKATREECALYAFNMMQGANNYQGIKKVSYSTLLGGYITNSALVDNGSANAPDANKAATFGKDFNLVMNKEDGDDFGRMAGHSWAVRTKGNIISGTYYDADDLVGEYYAKVTKGEVAELLGASFIKDVKEDGDYEVWVNGVKDDTKSKNSLIDIDKLTKGNKENLVDKAGAAATETGNGVETLIYAGIDEKDNSWIRIVIVDTFLAKVTNVAKDNTVTVTILDGKDNDGNPVEYLKGVTWAKDGKKIKAEGFKENDYVLVTVDQDTDGKGIDGPLKSAVKTIEKATVVEDTVSRYQKVDKKITVTAAGTEYVAALNTACDGSDVKAANDSSITQRTIVDGKKHVLYIDAHGYLVALAKVNEASDYVYVSHFGLIDTEGAFDGHALGAKVYYVDGTDAIVTVNTKWTGISSAKDGEKTADNEFRGVDINADTFSQSSLNSSYAGNIYKLVTKDNKAVLSIPGTPSGAPTDPTAADYKTEAAPYQVKKSISTIILDGDDADNSIKANGKTVFFYVNNKAWDSKDLKVTAYVGINNVRSSKDANATVKTYIPNADNAKMADAVLVRDGLEADASDTVYFFTGNYDDNDGSKTVTYDTYINGEEYDLIITYDTYADKEKALDSFVGTDGKSGVINKFFTLKSDNTATAETLLNDKKTEVKVISKVCYENDLDIVRADDDTDEFTFKANSSKSKNGTYFAYGDSKVVVINLVNKDPKIESASDLKKALSEKVQSATVRDDGFEGYKVTGVKVCVQYADDSSNTVSCIYIVGVTASEISGS